MATMVANLALRYNMRVVKKRALTAPGLVALFTTNLYIVSHNPARLIAVAGDVSTGGTFLLQRAPHDASRRLSHVLRRVHTPESTPLGMLLHIVQGVRVYAHPDTGVVRTTAFVDSGFEPTSEEMARFHAEMYVCKRRVMLRGEKALTIDDVARRLVTTAPQLLGYFSRDSKAMALLSGAVCHVGACGTERTPFFVANRLLMRRLLGYTLMMLGGNVYRLADGSRMFLSMGGRGHLTPHAEGALLVGKAQLNIRVGARTDLANA